MEKKSIIIISLIILLALLIRVYLFILTINQSLWWDEAEYLNIARTFATGISLPNLGIVRPILLSLIIFPFYYLTSIFMNTVNSLLIVEIISRGIILIFSFFAILGTFMCGKELYGKSVGFFSAFFITVFSLMLYLETKIMTDIPSFTFFIFGIYFFYLFIKKQIPKYLYFSAGLFAIGSLFRINILIFFFVLLFFYLITKEVKIKQALISITIFITMMIPYIIYGYIVYKEFVFAGATKYVSPGDYYSNFMLNISNYIIITFKYIFIFSINYQISFLILILSIFFILIIIKNKKILFLSIIIVVSFFSSSLFINHVEDRYIINAFLGIFIIISSVIMYLYRNIKNKNKIIAYIFIVVLILLIATTQIWNGYSRTINDINHNKYVKESGFWLRDNLLPNELSISSNPMQIGYYSNKYSYSFPKNKTDMDALLKEKDIKYFVIFESEKSLMFVGKDYNLEDLRKYNLTIINQTDEFIIYKFSDI